MPWLTLIQHPVTYCSCLKPKADHESNALVCRVASTAALPISFYPAGSPVALVYPTTGQDWVWRDSLVFLGFSSCQWAACHCTELPSAADQCNKVSLLCMLFNLPKALGSNLFPKLFLPSPLWAGYPSCLQPFDLLSHCSVWRVPTPSKRLPSFFFPLLGGKLLSWDRWLPSPAFTNMPQPSSLCTCILCTCILKADKIVTYFWLPQCCSASISSDP